MAKDPLLYRVVVGHQMHFLAARECCMHSVFCYHCEIYARAYQVRIYGVISTWLCASREMAED